MDNINFSDLVNRQIDLRLEYYQNIIIIGVGGIGSWVAFNLALSGRVKKITLIDADKIETSNLNRTPFRLCDIGYYKVDALKYLILERRTDTEIDTRPLRTTREMAAQFRIDLKIDDKIRYCEDPDKFMDYDNVIIDCRDDVYDDFYSIPCKYYKIGYDGFSLTIDGNPRNTAVWGRANGYRNTPSFICPAQLAACLVVNDVLATHNESNEEYDATRMNLEDKSAFDYSGRLNTVITFDSRSLMEIVLNSNQKDS